jgi:membrane protein DedA with SNARE-associated domain
LAFRQDQITAIRMEQFLERLVHGTVEFIRLHAVWAGPIMFIVSFGESFVGISILFPGTSIMVLAGTMVHSPLNPHGELNPWPLLIGGILGAVLGDAISFWMGRRFGHVVEKWQLFERHPDVLPRGYAFFNRFSFASVFVGRFFGPVRAVIPLVAGIMKMSWPQFWFANIGSALIWAPALLLAGTGFRRAAEAINARHGWHIVIAAAAIIVCMLAIWLAERFHAFDRLKSLFARRAQ